MWKSRVSEHRSLSPTVGRRAIQTKGKTEVQNSSQGTGGIHPTWSIHPHSSKSVSPKLKRVVLWRPDCRHCSFWKSLRSCLLGILSSPSQSHWRPCRGMPHLTALFIERIRIRQTMADWRMLTNVWLPKLILFGVCFPCGVTRAWTAFTISSHLFASIPSTSDSIGTSEWCTLMDTLDGKPGVGWILSDVARASLE